MLRGRSQGLAALARLGREEQSRKVTMEPRFRPATLPATINSAEATRGSGIALAPSIAASAHPCQHQGIQAGTHSALTRNSSQTGTRIRTGSNAHTGVASRQREGQVRPQSSLVGESERASDCANGAAAECATSWTPHSTQLLDPPGPGYAPALPCQMPFKGLPVLWHMCASGLP